MEAVRFERVKEQGEISIAGVALSLTVEDGSIKSVAIHGEGEEQIVIKPASSYSDSLHLMRPERPKEKEVYVVTGTLAGTEYRAEFDDDFDAKQHMRNLEGTPDTELSIDEETVPVARTEI